MRKGNNSETPVRYERFRPSIRLLAKYASRRPTKMFGKRTWASGFDNKTVRDFAEYFIKFRELADSFKKTPLSEKNLREFAENGA